MDDSLQVKRHDYAEESRSAINIQGNKRWSMLHHHQPLIEFVLGLPTIRWLTRALLPRRFQVSNTTGEWRSLTRRPGSE